MNETKIIDTILEDYLESGSSTERDADLRAFSGTLDGKLDQHNITGEDLAEYERLAVTAGFYAGFKAALSMVIELR